MKAFFRTYLASLLAGMTLFGLGLIVLLASGGSKDKPIASDSVLHIQFSGLMKDYVPRNAFPTLNEILGEQGAMSMEEIVFNIYKAAADDNIKSIFLEIDIFSAGTPQLREIRTALRAFQDSGKHVNAYSSILTRQGYYVGSVADSLWLSPTGIMEWNGLASSRPYLKGALDKLGIKMNLIRGSDNAYKSAGEPLIAEKMSEANREQISSYLNSVWMTSLEDIAADGRASAETLNTLADNGVIIRPEEALEAGLVDGLLYEDEVMDKYYRSGEYTYSKFVSVKRYSREPSTVRGDFKNRIAVLYAEGEVALGKSSDGTMGSETIVEALRDIRTNDKIKALVLRINSPGGVSLAGDAMWREVELVREVMPVIVSMGNVAASAGYQIAAPADTIVAQPQTITGSIGVFMLYPTAEELMNDKLGIHFETVATNAMGDFGTFDRPLTDAEYEVLQKNVDHFYGHFKDQVANGRGLDRTYVDSIARGRVWTGTQALDNGLVDVQGGLIDAIRIAKEMANIEGTPRISSYPPSTDPLSEFLNSMGTQQRANVEAELGPLAPIYQQWKEIEPMMGIQKRMTEYSMDQPL
ncbi:MAG: signal peptide peptidase SppA [Flavobacteriia bacterium]|nr:signal peptide peptidase SppA [Flavobacteriia bacterium]